jgi:DNA-binding MarR family transcriptional regulator/DNA-binding CsgD family transcriptional regulator
MALMPPSIENSPSVPTEPGTTDMEQVLRSLDVSANATMIYILLSAAPGIGAADLADRAGLTDRDFDEAVTQLTDRGLIEIFTGHESARQPALRPTDPEFAFAAWLREREAELGRQQLELAAAKAAIAAAATAYHISTGHAAYRARLLLSPQEAIDRATEIMAAAVHECVIALPDVLGTLGQADTQLAELASRGTRVAIICGDAARSGPARINLDALERAGVQVRTLPMVTVPLIASNPPPTALLWPGFTDISTPAVLTRDQVFAQAVAGIFESHWDIAAPLQKKLAPDPVTGLTPVNQALLVMLASGLSGEAAARRLGTSLTTVRRQIANLKDTLQADSLFQAGCSAAKRGWI